MDGLQRLRNVDIYVTGSNSKMLSKDVMTAFRGRGDSVVAESPYYLPAICFSCCSMTSEAEVRVVI